MSKQKNKKASEGFISTPFQAVSTDASAKITVTKEESTAEISVDRMALDEFLKLHKVNIGLVASFRYEATKNPSLLDVKTADEWKQAFAAQSRVEYI